DPAPSGLAPDEARAYEQLSNFYAKHVAYAQIMSTRPQTLYGFSDSPIDLAAFAIDHGDGTGQPGLIAKILQGELPGDLTRDDILDNITLYWLTNTGVSAARYYWENKAGFFEAKPISIPYAISVFPDELYQAPRSWAERAYPDNLIHYNRPDGGGHFAAWEQPALFCGEMRTAFRSLRGTPAGQRGSSSPQPDDARAPPSVHDRAMPLPWPVRSVIAGAAGTTALTLAYATERRVRSRRSGPLDYDDSLVPGQIVASIMHLPHVTDREERDLGLTLRW